MPVRARASVEQRLAEVVVDDAGGVGPEGGVEGEEGGEGEADTAKQPAGTHAKPPRLDASQRPHATLAAGAPPGANGPARGFERREGGHGGAAHLARLQEREN